MKKIALLLVFFAIGLQVLMAQTKEITGKVTSAEDGGAIPGVTISIKGTTLGTITDMDGVYRLKVPQTAQTLIFSFVTMASQEIAIANQSTINVKMAPERIAVDEVVVTALGISREKKSLGYSSQEVKGDAIATVKSSSNFMNSLSGKVSGVQIKKNTNMGGSTNVVMRGSKSLTNSNQVLYVVDGVPINNQIGSAGGVSAQNQGGVGYDYGNAASDINPDDIESINVLKGSAATALYGSRASGGVIMIVTKKGTRNKGLGVTLNSNVAFSSIDKSTFPTYQNQYGGGYGKFYGPDGDAWFDSRTVDGVNKTDDAYNGTDPLFNWVPTTEDASYGAKFDGQPIYGWYSVDKESPWYKQQRPWQAAKNGPITFFETPFTTTNTVSIDNATDKGSVRLSYTNYDTKGLMPNSTLKKNNFLANGSWNVTDKLSVTASTNFTSQAAVGRNSTGYNDNILTSFRQWWEVNTDVKDQKTIYDLTHRNISWNYGPTLSGAPIYWDNPYYTRYQNYENDGRTRFIGNMSINYKLTSWLEAYGRVSADTYNEYQEERRAVGSVATTFGLNRTTAGDSESGYLRRDITSSEFNYDFMLKFNKKINQDFNLSGILGATERRTKYSTLTSATNGGLVVPGIYSLQNSVSALIYPVELNSIIGVRGLYASASLSYKNMLYLDGTFRQDYASTLPVGKNKYNYPSITGAYVFSQMFKPSWLSFGKVRLNYAQVGNLAGYDQLIDTYVVNTPFNGTSYSLPNTKKNPELKSESTQSFEGGLEMKFLEDRVGFDLALYKTNSKDQIMPVGLSQTTGYSFRYVNAGEIENKGIELSLNLVPVQTRSFKWTMDINFAKNKNTVVSLYPGVHNLPLGTFGGGVTLNAFEGEAYGVLKGTDYTYDANGQKIIDAKTGKPVKTTTADKVIGNVTPDWTGGMHNSFTYKSITFSFLIDMQKGGDIFSLDMYYGTATGLYPATVGNNDLGNPVRNPNLAIKDASGKITGYDPASGGYVIQGVNVDSKTGVSTPNITRVNATSYAGWGYKVEPNKAFVYDAGYVKLREVSIAYTLPSKFVAKAGLQGVVISAVGSNLWIIHKNLPYADPESGLAAGNVQGYSVGSLPGTRDFGFNVKLNF
ncbi:MAG TPA: SusC/RagA family TonB-linked outer membrane protein [Prolixibacteraceae bacterium]|jgi:TonB-linked SusC/RagA family outer membrane protein|nr:SusC/RagA family TonB-linked outer membrane protein [Prolixibacteraceae bacterium]